MIKKLLALVTSLVVMLTVVMITGSAATGLPAADANGTIKLVEDVELSETFTVSEGEVITLDLAGHKIEMTKAETLTKNHEAINVNKGTLTIVDTVGGGSIVYNYTGDNTGNGGYAANTITNNQGTLVIDGVTVINNTENKTDAAQTETNQIAYVVDARTNGGIGDVSTTIKNSVITGKKGIAVRGFANSTSKMNSIVIENSTLTGGVQVHDANANANKAELTIMGDTTITSSTMCVYVYGVGDSSNISVDIEDGTFNGENASYGAVYLYNVTNGGAPFEASIKGGTYNGDVWVYTKDANGGYVDLKVISGGTYTMDVTANLIEEKDILEEDGVKVVVCKEHKNLTQVVNEPTCEEDGFTTNTCEDCGYSFVSDETEATGHSTTLINVKEATCSEEGYTGDEYCEACGKTIATGESIKKLAHEYEDGKCICGKEEPQVKPVQKPEKEPVKGPETGDPTSVTTFMMMLVSSTYVLKRRRA